MLAIVGLIIPFFGLIALGVVAALIRRRPLDELGWLNTFVIYIALPALFFRLLSETPVETLTRWDFVAVNLGVTFGVFLLCFLLGLLTTRSGADATIQGLAGAYGNIGYMGPGIALLAFGEAAAVPVALIFCFENTMHFVVAPAAMALSGRGSGGVLRLAFGVFVKIATHPFILATAAGIGAAVAGWQPPEALARLLGYLAQAAAPCALFAMGVTIALRPLSRVPGALGYILPVKLILHPLAMFFALSALGGVEPLWIGVATLLAALPTATNVFVIASQYGVWVERASAAILTTTALSVLTVSALLFAIAEGRLPGLTLGG